VGKDVQGRIINEETKCEVESLVKGKLLCGARKHFCVNQSFSYCCFCPYEPKVRGKAIIEGFLSHMVYLPIEPVVGIPWIWIWIVTAEVITGFCIL